MRRGMSDYQGIPTAHILFETATDAFACPRPCLDELILAQSNGMPIPQVDRVLVGEKRADAGQLTKRLKRGLHRIRTGYHRQLRDYD